MTPGPSARSGASVRCTNRRGRPRRPDRHHAGCFLLDHDERDDLPGMTSIVGGKLTTYRMMAEQISDHVCEKFGVDAECRTADEPLPGSEDFTVLRDYMDDFGLRSPIGRRAPSASARAPTKSSTASTPTRRLRVRGRHPRGDSGRPRHRGHGPQLRAHPDARLDGQLSGRDLLSPDGERTRARVRRKDRPRLPRRPLSGALEGQRHALWGEQLSQAALNYALHATTQNRDQDPADGEPVDFSASIRAADKQAAAWIAQTWPPTEGQMAIESEVLVIGGGLGGLTSALAAAREGADVRLVSHKQSTLRQASGLVDVLGSRRTATAR